MKKTILVLCVILGAAQLTALQARLLVVATYPYIGDIVTRVGGERVEVHSLAPGTWDQHRVVPKPSLIARVRGADLLVVNGADLETAWLTPLINESNNGRVRRGGRGYLDLSAHVKLIDVPKALTRALGDVHPSGNPHYYLDPDNIPPCTRAVCERLCALDPAGAAEYRGRRDVFLKTWSKKCGEWEARMAPRKGLKVVQYHTLFNYLLKKYGLTSVASVERYPGIPPASRQIRDVIEAARREGVKKILTSSYDPGGPVRMIAGKTGARVTVLPHDVNAARGVSDIVGLFDCITRTLGDD